MLRVPFKIWYGGFAEHVLKNVVCEEARDRFIHTEIAKDAWEFYDAPDRFYHNTYHVWWMYNFAWQNSLVLTEAQELAILFHDVIYTPGDSKNETLSAEYCYDVLSPHVEDQEMVMDACEIIEDTAKHFDPKPKLGNWQSPLVLDLDIMNMSLPYTQFIEWNAAVVQEYSFLDKEKRIKFLKFFLEKKPILHSDQLKGREPLIRENLLQLIKEMELEIQAGF